MRVKKLVPIKGNQKGGTTCEISKETKQNFELGFLCNGMHTHVEACVRGPTASICIL